MGGAIGALSDLLNVAPVSNGGSQIFIMFFIYAAVFKYFSMAITGNYTTQIETIPYTEMNHPDLLLDICQALYILRNENYIGHLSDEIKLYYFLLDILKSSSTLQKLTWRDPKLKFDAYAALKDKKKNRMNGSRSDVPS